MNNKDIIQKLNLENLLLISKILRKKRVIYFLWDSFRNCKREKYFKR